jgi:proline racemase
MPTRIVLSGFPRIPGDTMVEKSAFLRDSDELSGLGPMICTEPRGHNGQYGALLTEPVNPDSEFGVVFFAPNFFPGGCGHATIGVATALVETGVISGSFPVEFGLDTPVGTVRVRVNGGPDGVESVSFRNVPSFLYKNGAELDVSGIGRVKADIAFGGNFYAYLWAPDLGVRVREENLDQLRRVAKAALRAAREQLRLENLPPSVPNRLGAVMLRDEPVHPEADQKNTVIGSTVMDRSPCGTGTSGWMAALHARGELKVGDEFVHEGIVGTLFRGKVLEETTLGKFDAIITEITGSAYITAFHDFVIDPRDPFPKGFNLPDA